LWRMRFVFLRVEVCSLVRHKRFHVHFTQAALNKRLCV